MVAVDGDEKIETAVVFQNGHGFRAKFFNAPAKCVDASVVFAIATIADSFGGIEASLDISLGDVEENGGFDSVAGGGGGVYDGEFFAFPAADAAENEREMSEIFALKVWQNPFVESVAGDQGAGIGEADVVGLLAGAHDHAGGEKFGAERFGKADALGVFAGHGQTKNVDRTSAEPLFDS